jgi:predicted RND superfamily exporter protein
MAIDFAIHFVSRFRQRFRETPDLDAVLLWTVTRPGKGILRNALLFGLGFSPMIFSALTPYITVGVFMMAIMFLSAGVTIIYLPALISMWQGWLIKGTREGLP